jgi:DNA ligase-associated metallophosphoesterase
MGELWLKTSAGDLKIELQGERVVLLPERALYWIRKRTLFVADVHWGKASAFQASSMAVPEGATREDLMRLSWALERTAARRLVILGDVFHAKAGRPRQVVNALTQWRARHLKLEILLVRGNHDYSAGDPPEKMCIECVDGPVSSSPFILQHHPAEPDRGYVLAGHLHPSVLLFGAGGQSLKLPCFFFGANVGVLPAFGSFTGTALVKPRRGDHVYVIVEKEVVAVAA